MLYIKGSQERTSAHRTNLRQLAAAGISALTAGSSTSGYGLIKQCEEHVDSQIVPSTTSNIVQKGGAPKPADSAKTDAQKANVSAFVAILMADKPVPTAADRAQAAKGVGQQAEENSKAYPIIQMAGKTLGVSEDIVCYKDNNGVKPVDMNGGHVVWTGEKCETRPGAVPADKVSAKKWEVFHDGILLVDHVKCEVKGGKLSLWQQGTPEPEPEQTRNDGPSKKDAELAGMLEKHATIMSSFLEHAKTDTKLTDVLNDAAALMASRTKKALVGQNDLRRVDALQKFQEACSFLERGQNLLLKSYAPPKNLSGPEDPTIKQAREASRKEIEDKMKAARALREEIKNLILG